MGLVVGGRAGISRRGLFTALAAGLLLLDIGWGSTRLATLGAEGLSGTGAKVSRSKICFFLMGFAATGAGAAVVAGSMIPFFFCASPLLLPLVLPPASSLATFSALASVSNGRFLPGIQHVRNNLMAMAKHTSEEGSQILTLACGLGM